MSAQLPSDFTDVSVLATTRMRPVPGFLSDREARFLAVAAVASPASGCILEIGSYMGKSTVVLATIADAYGQERVVAVDPFTSPSSTDPDLIGAESSYEAFEESLRSATLLHKVEVHRATSGELAAGWSRPIRLLWVDGDHTYEGTRTDLTLFLPHLADGAIVAMHDALHEYEGPIRGFVEMILESGDFGPAGICGSIAWAQYRPNGRQTLGRRIWKRYLAAVGRRLFPYVKYSIAPRGFKRIRYKLLRSLLPHGDIHPHKFTGMVND